MLVYANCLPFDSECSVEEMFDVLADWLKRKTRQHFTGDMLKQSRAISVNVGDLQTWVDGDDKAFLYALRYAHPDSRTSGRQWITEIGFRHDLSQGESLCTVVVQTSEISTRVIDNVQVSRPIFVPQIANLCSVSNRVVGSEVITLDDAAVEALPYHIDDEYRKHPIVLISPNSSGDYLVQPEEVILHTVGLAEVMKVPQGMDTWWMARVLGDHYAAYRGAINIIFPQRYTSSGRKAFSKKLMPNDLEDMLYEHINIEGEILSIITHRSNLPMSWKHISPEKVRETSRTREITRRREEASKTGEQNEYVALLEEDNVIQQEKINKVEESLRSLQSQNKEISDDLYEFSNQKDAELDKLLKEKDAELAEINFTKNNEIQSLKATLSMVGKRNGADADSGISDTALKSFVNVFNQSPTLEDSLNVIKTLFPERICVLDSAWRSTKGAKKFRHQQKAFELLLKLATVFWQAKMEDKPDKDAGSFYGDDFSAWESEGIMDNPRARKERTFIYEGTSIQITNHLKIGVKASDAETLWIHFDWDADKQVIVIGHCGKHLFVPK